MTPRRLQPRSVTFLAPVPRVCEERGCGKRPDYIVTTMGGPRLFCEPHAAFYIERGPDIYPVERFVP